MSTDFAISAETLSTLGRAAGLDAVGATTADPFPELAPRLEAYAARGLTGFEAANVADRIDPTRWLAGAKSLIAVGLAYLTPQGREAAGRKGPHPEREGRMSVYAFGEDYHLVMKRKLAELHELLEETVGHAVQARPVVDTSPAVDRRIAQRAGIGWVGKNCMVYGQTHGSYLFLGALVVDLAVEPASTELREHCGDCTLCLTACPTGALLAPGMIDAKRCLSYVTQMKGIIPREFRKPMGRRIWGCDTCQWVCPENRGVEFAAHAEFRPVSELTYPDLIEILTWSNREFVQRYGSTAAGWRGVRTWQRNALIALGNCRNPEAVSYILPFLRHDRAELRASAAWALAEINCDGTRSAVAAALAVETHPEVRAEMAWAEENAK